MNIQTVMQDIHAMAREDVDRVLEAARMRRDYLARTSIRVGTKVQFDAGTRGIITGTVSKINPKRTKVATNMGTWNVTHSLLEPVEA